LRLTLIAADRLRRRSAARFEQISYGLEMSRSYPGGG